MSNSQSNWGPKLFENQYRSMEHSFDLTPWDELTDEQREQLIQHGRLPVGIEEFDLPGEEEPEHP